MSRNVVVIALVWSYACVAVARVDVPAAAPGAGITAGLRGPFAPLVEVEATFGVAAGLAPIVGARLLFDSATVSPYVGAAWRPLSWQHFAVRTAAALSPSLSLRDGIGVGLGASGLLQAEFIVAGLHLAVGPRVDPILVVNAFGPVASTQTRVDASLVLSGGWFFDSGFAVIASAQGGQGFAASGGGLVGEARAGIVLPFGDAAAAWFR